MTGSMLWSSLGWMLTVAVATAAAAPRRLPAQMAVSAAVQTAPADAAAQTILADLQQQIAILNDANAAQLQRDEAARRLLSRPSQETRQILISVLVDASNPRGQLAVARALSQDPRPDAAFINPLFDLLGTDRHLTEAGALALAAYRNEPEVFTRLVNFANSLQLKPASRLATIRALGTMNEKRAAEALIGMMTRADESSEVRGAAADALVQMTGLRENGRDVQRWLQWWRSNADKNDARFQADQLAQRAARFNQLWIQHARLADEVRGLLEDRYRAAAAAEQPQVLLRYLSSGEPAVRAIGADILYDEAITGRPAAPSVRKRLREMVGDSSTEVRAEVVRALRTINDADALQPLLTQLSQEPDPDVRAGIASALALIGNLQAVPELLRLLDDPSFRVAESAADALRTLGPDLHEKNPALAHEAALKLAAAIDRRDGTGEGPEALGLRGAAVLALAPLRDAQVAPTLRRLLQPDASVDIRRGALRALGELRDERDGERLAGYLQDREAIVRLEAVRALGQLAAPEYADAVLERIGPAEDDPSVQKEAWDMLAKAFLAKLPKEKLGTLADRFSNEPGRRLEILKNLATRQEADTAQDHLDQLAYTQQNIGETLVRLEQPADAETYFRQALEHWEAQKVENMVTERLIEQRTDALLKSRQYAEVARFGQQLITRQASYQQTIGSRIRAEAERLAKVGNGQSIQDALTLIGEAKKMNPPLAAQYREVLEEIESRLSRGKDSATTKPQAETPFTGFARDLGSASS